MASIKKLFFEARFLLAAWLLPWDLFLFNSFHSNNPCPNPVKTKSTLSIRANSSPTTDTVIYDQSETATYKIHEKPKIIYTYLQNSFYIGLGVGYSCLNNTESCNIDFGATGAGNIELYDNHALKDNSIATTIFFGYIHHTPDKQFIIGIEPYISLIPLKDKSVKNHIDPIGLGLSTDLVTISIELKQEWVFGAPLKAGIILRDSCMLYGLGGIEITKIKHQTQLSSESSSAASMTKKQLHFLGLIIGGGLEYVFQNYHLAIEVKNTFYEKKTVQQSFTSPVSAINESSFNPSTSTVLVKLLYFF